MAQSAKTKKAVAAIRDALSQKSLSSEDNEALIGAATDILNRDYWDDVRGLTADIIRQVKDGEIKSREELHDRLHEAIDGSQRVMYTWQARLGLLSTNNLEAYEDEMGEPPPGPEQQMFMAMQADVQAQLDDEDVDGMLEDE